MTKVVIEVRKLKGLRPGYVASIKQCGETQCNFERIGDSPNEAIGHLVDSYPKLFNVEIITKEVFDEY